jgi:RHS repeat-associated protein
MGFNTAATVGLPDRESLKFTGKERDSETGLDYFGARYFGGAQGRFTSVDPELIPRDITNPQMWNKYAYAVNNPMRYVDPDGAAVMDAGAVKLGTASMTYYKPQGNFDAAVMLQTAFGAQIGSGQSSINRNLESFEQNRSSFWFPTQNSGEGGCVLGCVTSYSEQPLGVSLNLSFKYDKNDNLVGATITPAVDTTVPMITSKSPAIITTMSRMPGGLNPMAQITRVDINASALRNLTPQQLQAVAKTAVNQPQEVRQALTEAISREQKRRTDEQKKQQQNCQAGQSGCQAHN